MAESPNEALVKKGYQAFSAGDMDTLRLIMTPDVVHSVPGKSQVSGEYKGIDNVLAHYGQLFELSGGTLNVDLKSVKAEGNDKVVSVHNSAAKREGTSFEEDETLHFTIAGGKISRLDESHADPAGFDNFWG